MRNMRVGRLERKLKGVPGGSFVSRGFVALCAVASAFGIYGVSRSTSLSDYTKSCPEAEMTAHLDNGALVDCFIDEHADKIREAASREGIPPELIAATIKSENNGRPRYEDWKDDVGTNQGLDTSLGVGQVKISTAQRLDRQRGNVYTREETVRRLRDPETNIGYMARFYGRELHSLGVKDSYILLDDPRTVAELASRYVGGRRHQSQLAGLAGANVVAYLMDASTFEPFAREGVDVDKVATSAADYLCLDGRALLRNSRYAGLVRELANNEACGNGR